MVAPQILVLIVGVRILLGEINASRYDGLLSILVYQQGVSIVLRFVCNDSHGANIGPFVYRLGRKILNL